MPEKTHTAEYYTDYVGRRRKLSAGAILAIISDFENGAATRDLAERYGVSTSLVRTVVWHSKRGTRS